MAQKFALALFLLLIVCEVTWAQSAPHGDAATVAQAKAALDLSGKPLVQGIGEPQTQVAFQSFQADGDAEAVAKKIDQILASRGLHQSAGASFTTEYATATYQKSGFVFNLMVMPAGTPNTVSVNLQNLGNVDLTKLSKPEGTTELYVQPSSAMYTSSLPRDAATKKCRELLEHDGWEWFGDTTASFFMRQNAVRLQVMCSESTAQGGKTVLQYSAQQLSSELPLIDDLVRISYADTTKRLEGDSELPVEEFWTAYRLALEERGWKATTERPVTIDFRDHLIFRNSKRELAELVVHSVDHLTRFDLEFKTAAQVDDEIKLADEALAQAKAKRDADSKRMANPPKFTLDAPATASLKSSTKKSVEFQVAAGTALNVVTQWLAKKKASGWQVVTTIESREVGQFQLTQGEMTLDLSFVDPGFIAGEITIDARSPLELVLKK